METELDQPPVEMNKHHTVLLVSSAVMWTMENLNQYGDTTVITKVTIVFIESVWKLSWRDDRLHYRNHSDRPQKSSQHYQELLSVISRLF